MAKAATEEGCIKTVTLQRTHLIIAIVMLVGTPIVSTLIAYRNLDKRAEAATVEKMMDDHRLDQEARFVKKEDFKGMEGKINRIAEDVAEIKGFLKNR